jgi:hypothetical protein
MLDGVNTDDRHRGAFVPVRRRAGEHRQHQAGNMDPLPPAPGGESDVQVPVRVSHRGEDHAPTSRLSPRTRSADRTRPFVEAS